jgi:C4-dicarboxylate-specific signal transduction histidine kinase
LLASNTPDLDMFREILDDIIRDDKRAGSVIHRLRLMLQKEKQEPERFNVNDAVREVVQLLRSEVIGRNVALSMDLAPRLPAVQAGRIEVQQALVNLLLNAFDAVEDLPRDRREILIRTSPDEDAVVVAIRDRGCGIQSPDINSIFESFFTTKPAGLGMGLAICRRMVQAHGGRIWAANNEGAGATVSFSLPSTQASWEPGDA